MRATAALLALSVLLAGWGGIAPPPASVEAPVPDSPPSPPADSADPSTPAPTPTPDAPTARPPPSYDNPWNASPIRYAVVNEVNDRRIRPHVRDALAFWERNREQTPHENVTFAPARSRAGADLVFTYRASVETCPLERGAVAGCVESDGDQNAGPTRIQVEAGYANRSVRRVATHYLGHALGVGHRDTDLSAMAPITTLARRPATDLHDRAVPWANRTVRVYADASALVPDARPEFRERVHTAVAYWNRGGAGTIPRSANVTTVETRRRADVVVVAADEREATSRISRVHAIDFDADDAFEYRTDATVVVSTEVPAEAREWHVARRLGLLLTNESTSLPYELQPQTNDWKRETDWWY
jgi:hypothetical protein